MDTAIWIALITGGFTVIGAILRIVEKYFPGKTASKPAEEGMSSPLQKPDHIDERIAWYVEKLERDNERDRVRHLEELAEVRRDCRDKLDSKQTDYEHLQRLYLEAIERIESLSVKRDGQS